MDSNQRRIEKTTYCLCPFHYRDQLPYFLRTMKFKGNLAIAKVLGDILGLLIKTEIHQMESKDWLVTSVPLSPRRERQRGYNQAAILAKQLARRAVLPYQDLLDKKRDSPRQSEFEFLERYENVKGVYQARQSLSGLNIIIVDDILTSGATLFSAIETLYAAGAARVIAAAVASGRRCEQHAKRGCVR